MLKERIWCRAEYGLNDPIITHMWPTAGSQLVCYRTAGAEPLPGQTFGTTHSYCRFVRLSWIMEERHSITRNYGFYKPYLNIVYWPIITYLTPYSAVLISRGFTLDKGIRDTAVIFKSVKTHFVIVTGRLYASNNGCVKNVAHSDICWSSCLLKDALMRVKRVLYISCNNYRMIPEIMWSMLNIAQHFFLLDCPCAAPSMSIYSFLYSLSYYFLK